MIASGLDAIGGSAGVEDGVSLGNLGRLSPRRANATPYNTMPGARRGQNEELEAGSTDQLHQK